MLGGGGGGAAEEGEGSGGGGVGLEGAGAVGEVGAERRGRQELQQLRIRNSTEGRRHPEPRLDLEGKLGSELDIETSNITRNQS